MSYIHEALKKAQKDRDVRDKDYSGILSVCGRKKRLFSGRSLGWVALVIILIFLAFATYSWLDFKTRQTPSPDENKDIKPQPAPKQKSVYDVKEIYERARIYYKNGRLKDAKRLYKETLRVAPDHIGALNNLGVIYIQEKDFQAARNNFERAIRLKPGYVDPYYNLACIYAVKSKLKKSLGYLKKAVSLDQSVRDWARVDNDLKKLRGIPEFEEMVKKGKD
ncbi:MAG TPA: hypothetical protein DDW42_03810 [Desulfobacteraceae bacterium]|nr:hypothetical protein [Desulfobacteraceae bacterium]